MIVQLCRLLETGVFGVIGATIFRLGHPKLYGPHRCHKRAHCQLVRITTSDPSPDASPDSIPVPLPVPTYNATISNWLSVCPPTANVENSAMATCVARQDGPFALGVLLRLLLMAKWAELWSHVIV